VRSTTAGTGGSKDDAAMVNDDLPPADVLAVAAGAYQDSRTNLRIVAARARLLDADADAGDDVFTFSAVCGLLGHFDRETAVGLAAAAITRLLETKTVL
jgi:hypothetical protein